MSKVDLDTVNLDHDDDADLDALDDGSNIDSGDDTDEVDTAADDAKVVARDAEGKFVSNKDKTDDDEEEEEEEGDDKDKTGKVGEADEAEGEDEGEGEDEDEEDENATTDPKNYAIRFHKAQAKLARLEAELAEARAAGGKVPVEKAAADPFAEINAKLETLYDEVEEARANGDTKTAAQLQREIDKSNREIVRIEATEISSRTTSVAQENERYNTMLDVIEGKVAVIDPRSPDFDRKQVQALEFHVEAYEKMGITAANALRQASRLLFGYDPLDPEVPEPKATKPKKDKKPASVAKAVDTQKRQPPSADDRGVNRDSTKLDVNTLSDDELDALPESKLAQLRGDFL